MLLGSLLGLLCGAAAFPRDLVTGLHHSAELGALVDSFADLAASQLESAMGPDRPLFPRFGRPSSLPRAVYSASSRVRAPVDFAEKLALIESEANEAGVAPQALRFLRGSDARFVVVSDGVAGQPLDGPLRIVALPIAADSSFPLGPGLDEGDAARDRAEVLVVLHGVAAIGAALPSPAQGLLTVDQLAALKLGLEDAVHLEGTVPAGTGVFYFARPRELAARLAEIAAERARAASSGSASRDVVAAALRRDYGVEIEIQ